MLLAIVAAAVMVKTKGDIDRGRNIELLAKAEALADAGLASAVHDLLAIKQAGTARTLPRHRRYEFADGVVEVLIEDEDAKIDLNAAPDALLRGLFLSVGMEEQAVEGLVDAVLDWRDPDDLRHLHGAEDADYRAMGLAYEAKDAPFQAVEELRQVPGMTRELYEAVAPALTVHSGRARIDPLLASRLVLSALPGIDDASLQALLALGTTQESEAAPQALPSLGRLRQYLAKSRLQVLRLRAMAQTASEVVFVRDAVVRLTRDPEKPYEVLDWRRGERFSPAALTAD